MNENRQNRLGCGEFEAMLAEALDYRENGHKEDGAGSLTAAAYAGFEAHGRSCAICGPLWEEAREGMLLLRSLKEVEPPKNLVHNVLAATSLKDVPAKSEAGPGITTWQERLRRRLQSSLSGALHSRFATSFAMAFFSLSLTLTLAGVKISDVRNVDLHPSAVRKNLVLGYTHVEAKVTSYYENLRLVYEVQARVRELKKNASPAPDTNNDNNKQQNRKSAPDDGGRPQPRENYSREIDGSLIAHSPVKREGAQI